MCSESNSSSRYKMTVQMLNLTAQPFRKNSRKAESNPCDDEQDRDRNSRDVFPETVHMLSHNLAVVHQEHKKSEGRRHRQHRDDVDSQHDKFQRKAWNQHERSG